MNPHIATVMAAERQCDLQELAQRQRDALSAPPRRSWRESVRAYRKLRDARSRVR